MSSFLLAEEEVENFLSNLPVANIEEASFFLEQASEKPNPEKTGSWTSASSEMCATVAHFEPSCTRREKKCSACFDGNLLSSIEGNDRLLVFISFSVPIPTWKEFSSMLATNKGAFVLRGLPSNSFSLFSERVQDLRKQGIDAHILIDPEAFELYSVDAVPTLVLIEGSKHDKITGNRTPISTLRLFIQEGETRILSSKLLAQFETSHMRGS